MINRAALILKYKQPAVDWINESDPYNDNPGITVEDVNEDRTVYLISDESAEDSEMLEKWLRLNAKALLQEEMFGWYQDESLWPEKLTYSLFKSWFDVECHTVLIDTVENEIIDGEA